MLNNLVYTLNTIVASIELNGYFLLGMLAVLWSIHLINWMLRYRLNRFGILPRHLLGLPGIVFSPFLHGNFNHIFFNSFPLIILANFILILGFHTFVTVTSLIILFSGVAVWLFGRRAIHIGASGLIMGYWGFLLINAYHQPNLMAIILAIICIYYFGSFIFQLIPSDEKVSWEGHLFGALSGVLVNYLLPYFS